jgi:hypothetical protein
MIYDAVVPVGPDRQQLALTAIRSLQLFSQARKIIILSSKKNSLFFEDIKENKIPVIFADEDEVLRGPTLKLIREYMIRRGSSPLRAGWYFQQFLKMGISLQDDIADHYLIWDSDTIMRLCPHYPAHIPINKKTEPEPLVP